MYQRLQRRLYEDESSIFLFEDARGIYGQAVDVIVINHMYACKEAGIPYTYHCDINLSKTATKIGEISLSIDSYKNLFYTGNIGFSIDEQHRGNKYAGKACQAIKLIAKSHNLNTLYITCK